jgi:hypothetical protein
MQDRRARLHRRVDIRDVRQDLVIHLDELQGFARCPRIDRGNSGDGMTLIQRLLARHDIVEHVIERGVAAGVVGKVIARDDRLHAAQLLRLAGVDLLDARVRVRRAQDAPDQHAGRGGIGAEPGTAGHFVDAVGTQRTGADDLEIALALLGAIQRHN